MSIPVWTVEEYQEPHTLQAGVSSCELYSAGNKKVDVMNDDATAGDNRKFQRSTSISLDERLNSSSKTARSVSHSPHKRLAITHRPMTSNNNLIDNSLQCCCLPPLRRHSTPDPSTPIHNNNPISLLSGFKSPNSNSDQVKATARPPTSYSIHSKKSVNDRPCSSYSAHEYRSMLACFVIKEDNARFLLLALLILIYMIVGAGIFQALEETSETLEREKAAFKLLTKIEEVKLELHFRNCSWSSIEELIYRYELYFHIKISN